MIIWFRTMLFQKEILTGKNIYQAGVLHQLSFNLGVIPQLTDVFADVAVWGNAETFYPRLLKLFDTAHSSTAHELYAEDICCESTILLLRLKQRVLAANAICLKLVLTFSGWLLSSVCYWGLEQVLSCFQSLACAPHQHSYMCCEWQEIIYIFAKWNFVLLVHVWPTIGEILSYHVWFVWNT